jgi:Flp pilus assembly protein TadD
LALWGNLSCSRISHPALSRASTTLASEALDKAVSLDRSGAIDQAGNIARETLCIDPMHPRALHLRGTIAHRRRDHDFARMLILRTRHAEPSAKKRRRSSR